MDIRVLVSMIYKFFDKKSLGSGVKSEIILNQELDEEESRKAIIRIFEKRKLYSSYKDHIWGADLGDMQ